jgi:hypothetical protein
MSCLTDDLLRARMDEELGTAGSEDVDRHLCSCADCRARWTALAEQAGQVRSRLDALAPQQEAAAIDPVFAYSRYRQRYGEHMQGRAEWFNRAIVAWKRPLLSGLAVACAIVLLLSFAPGRSWAQRILSMLRVQKVAVIPVDLSALTAENGNGGSEKLIAQFISDNVVVTMNPGKPNVAPDSGAASVMAGFRVRTLDELGAPQRVFVSDEGAFHMTLDRDRMQALLDQVGRSDIQIPPAVDGSTVAVHIPRLVRSVYGNCPEKNGQPVSPVSGGTASDPSSGNCINFVQVPSPIVSVPPSLDLAALAEAGLQVAGMSAAEAQAFCRTVDWSSTLVIPIPERDSSYRQIAVDGVNGTLIEDSPHGNFAGTYTLIWIKNGIVYSLGGNGSASRALSAVQSLN